MLYLFLKLKSINIYGLQCIDYKVLWSIDPLINISLPGIQVHELKMPPTSMFQLWSVEFPTTSSRTSSTRCKSLFNFLDNSVKLMMNKCFMNTIIARIFIFRIPLRKMKYSCHWDHRDQSEDIGWPWAPSDLFPFMSLFNVARTFKYEVGLGWKKTNYKMSYTLVKSCISCLCFTTRIIILS